MRRTTTETRDSGAAWMPAAILTIFLLLITSTVLVFLTRPLETGVVVGELVPDIRELARDGSDPSPAWQRWSLYEDMLDFTWDESAGEQPWLVFAFEDTDCSHCWGETQEMSDRHALYGDRAQFVTVLLSLPIVGHNADLAEMAAYQDKTTHQGCQSDNADCASRGGESFDWLVVADLQRSALRDWEVPGTPSYLIVKPNGEVAWNHRTSEVGFDQALSTWIN